MEIGNAGFQAIIITNPPITMPNFFYFDANGQKKGAYTPEQLKELVLQGIVNPKTPLETEGGHKGLAGQIPGLFPAPSQTPKPPVGEEALMNMVQEEVKQPARTTPKYFFTDANGIKHLLDDRQLKTWAAQGVIKPNTPLETENGRKGLAGQIPGLFAVAHAQSIPHVRSTSAQLSTGLFCTNCGNSIAEHAAACMSCGANPRGHKRFCRRCGIALNPEQVVCIKCGAGLTAVSSRSNVTGSISPKVKILNTYFVLYCICVVVGVLLSLLQFADGDTIVPALADIFGLIGAIVLTVGYVFLTGVCVFGSVLLYQLWKLIPENIARTTPGKAIGLLFIPFFNFYWIFVAFKGLGTDMNATLQRYGIQYHVNEGLGLAACILTLCCIIPFIGMLTVIPGLIIMILFIRSVKNGAIASKVFPHRRPWTKHCTFKTLALQVREN